jgi:hypothetical protein
MDSQKTYQIELFYGYQECEGDIYHAFDTKACGEQYDGSEIEEHLAQLLDTTPDDERFDWSSMQIALPAGVVKTIQLDAVTAHAVAGQPSVPPADRTYIVTEVCPHCENEIEMRWDTDAYGFKAFCPVCGKRLMLCDECRHIPGGAGICDYSSQTDTCRRNPESTAELIHHDMQTLEARDAALQQLWYALADVPVEPDTDQTEAPFLHFPAGTDREDIWHWFDERHSKGVAYLLYGGAEDYVPETRRLYGLKKLCTECDSEHCVFNPNGACLAPYITGRAPRLHDDGCLDYCCKEED